MQQVVDTSSRQSLQPLFVVAGACPNSFCGMQAVMYCLCLSSPDPKIDFWWIKPMATNSAVIEPQTLDRQGKGVHKNDPGRSRALYIQFADLFQSSAGSATIGGGLLLFGVVDVGSVRRAYIEQAQSGERYYISLIWQESWTSNPFASSKFIIGKIVYQRDPSSASLYARPYAYKDGVLSVPAAGPEEDAEAAVPTDLIKLNCAKV
uniref:Uncharacterized protein n=1 Tax=Haptolina ericina TaxID=156174 RepID=A0A7S3ESB9_9EUKA